MNLSCRPVVACLILLALSAISVRADPVVTPAPTHAEDLSGPKVTCRREQVTGSRLTRKVCTTKAQRDRAREAGRTVLEDAQRRTPPRKG